MYDQVGFYSENGFAGPARGRAAPDRSPNMDFGGFDFSDMFAARRPRRRGGGAPRTPRRRRRGTSTTSFSQFFGGGGGTSRRPRPEKGARPRIRPEHRLLAGHPRHAGALEITRYEVCATCDGTGGARRRQHVCPQCNGTGNVTQMAGAMKFNLTCPRCDGTGRLTQRLPHLPRRRPHLAHRDGGSAHSARRAATARGCAWRARATPAPWARLRAISTSPRASSRIRFFRREGDNIEIKVPVRIDEAGLGAKIEVPTIDGRTLLKIPQGTQNGQKFRLREKGVFNSRTNKRGDQIVEVVLEAPGGAGRAHQGTAARDWPQLHPEDPRAAIWAARSRVQCARANPKRRT